MQFFRKIKVDATLGETTQKHWRRFAGDVPYTYMDELTPDLAHAYLSERYGAKAGKTYNNVKSALNAIYTLLLLDSGMPESPFARVPNRVQDGEHQRPITEAEFIRLHLLAPEPWKSAIVIAWFTGLRQKDVFLLTWREISNDVITRKPSKTARFNRAVQIPIHPQLQELLDHLPRTGDRVLGAWDYKPDSAAWQRQFGKLLKRSKIESNEFGIVNFNSLRDSFVTRCDAAQIPRHAIRGVVGHVDDAQTDLYSHDLTTARQIQMLPPVKLVKTEEH